MCLLLPLSFFLPLSLLAIRFRWRRRLLQVVEYFFHALTKRFLLFVTNFFSLLQSTPDNSLVVEENRYHSLFNNTYVLSYFSLHIRIFFLDKFVQKVKFVYIKVCVSVCADLEDNILWLYVCVVNLQLNQWGLFF